VSGDISQRKLDHIAISLEQDVSMRANPTGFDRWRFTHEALPELRPEDVDLRTAFLGRDLGAPILISSMTGGPERGETINRHLALAAEKLGLPMGVGSQRIIFERPEALRSFAVVRETAPSIPLYGNIGAVQLNYGFDVAKCREAVRLIGADGLYLHLNALQEVVQPGGDTDFRGLLAKIERLTGEVDFPILAKEVGCGIGAGTAAKLAAAGVAAVDVSGAGGTSWAKIEAARASDPAQRTLGEVFGDWGIPTTEALVRCRAALPGYPLVASGGVRTGLDVAKALALGADVVAIAMPLLGPATRSAEETETALRQVIAELRTAMFLLGVRDVATLRASRHLLTEVAGR
jgi:isopentenyl-diphosphate delta-isomerase